MVLPGGGRDDLPPAVTLPADLLGLTDHAGPHLLHVHLEPAPLAARAVLHVAASLALAGRADDVPGSCQLPSLPIVEFLQGDPQLVDHGLALVRLPATPHTPHATTEHHVENVHRRAEASPAAPAASLLDGLLSSLVIDLPLLSVGQDLVGLKQ